MSVNTQYIFLPTLGVAMMLLIIGLFFWKRFYRYRRPVYPYRQPVYPYYNRQIAFISQPYQQQPYQTVYTLPSIEQPPPSYYASINTGTYIKQ
jgi:hypothetical protein